MIAAYTSISVPVRVLGEEMAAAGLAPLRAFRGLVVTPMLSAPRVICTDSGFHSVNALTGAADQCGRNRSGNIPSATVHRNRD